MATATDWRWPPDSEATGWRIERTVVTESSSSVSARRDLHRGLVEHPVAQRLVAQEHVLDDVEVVAQRQVLVDRRDAERLGVPGPVQVDRLPSQRISPPSGAQRPEMVLISDDLPAPLSPTSAVTLPGGTSRSTSVRARTGPKVLVIPRSDSSGAVAALAAGAVLARRGPRL